MYTIIASNDVRVRGYYLIEILDEIRKKDNFHIIKCLPFKLFLLIPNVPGLHLSQLIPSTFSLHL